jgi:hypothetical protein
MQDERMIEVDDRNEMDEGGHHVKSHPSFHANSGKSPYRRSQIPYDKITINEL